jgi:hypothetical protein
MGLFYIQASGFRLSGMGSLYIRMVTVTYKDESAAGRGLQGLVYIRGDAKALVTV